MGRGKETSAYVRPPAIPDDMGGQGDPLDDRLADVIMLLSLLPLDEFHSFLDVGIGRGEISKWLARRGKSVTGTGLEIASYGCEIEELRRDHGVQIEECGVENMPFADASFDAVIMSHVLEHCPNVGMALREVRRVLKEEGCLIVFVPPHIDNVSAGHISVGWNVGQLMYVLLLNGFDCRKGRFVEYGQNVVAVVRKSATPLPSVRGDNGDIHILNEHGLFPVPVRSHDGYNDGFVGRLRAVNWDLPLPPRRTGMLKACARCGARIVTHVLPCEALWWLARKLWTVPRVLDEENDLLINPAVLR
ncbi:MAG: class I SAM-dependent methyltransferase [Armatimonadota bacterium]|nr:class I SAM-dependent methyltransferase [Armatimonadota bacterium]